MNLQNRIDCLQAEIASLKHDIQQASSPASLRYGRGGYIRLMETLLADYRVELARLEAET